MESSGGIARNAKKEQLLQFNILKMNAEESEREREREREREKKNPLSLLPVTKGRSADERKNQFE